jgi:tetratricopeptide (TPR) repeat protein
MYQAWDAEGQERISLARRALDLSADCADAYTLLAMEATSKTEEQSKLLAQAVAAGERALGRAFMEKEGGTLWAHVSARPYMRARACLAQCLWRLGDRVAAVEHYFALLRLNADDNQGIRYPLSDCLLTLGWHRELGKLLREYRWDLGALWRFNWALWAFRTKGNCVLSRRALKEALAQNQHIREFLLRRRPLPLQTPGHYSPHGVDEAAVYAANALSNWEATPGALQWLDSTP